MAGVWVWVQRNTRKLNHLAFHQSLISWLAGGRLGGEVGDVEGRGGGVIHNPIIGHNKDNLCNGGVNVTRIAPRRWVLFRWVEIVLWIV